MSSPLPQRPMAALTHLALEAVAQFALQHLADGAAGVWGNAMTIHEDGSRPEPRLMIALQIFVVVGLIDLLAPLLSPAATVGATWPIKALQLGRMAAAVALATWFLRLRGLRWRDVGFTRPKWLRLLWGVPVGFAMTGVLVAAINLALHAAGAPAADYSMFRPLKGNLAEYLFWAIGMTIFAAAFGEELIFRGFVRDGLYRLFGGRGMIALWASLLGQAVLFGLPHLYQGWSGAATAGTIGFSFGVIWLMMGRNLWAGIVLHAIFDLSSMTVFYLSGGPPGH